MSPPDFSFFAESRGHVAWAWSPAQGAVEYFSDGLDLWSAPASYPISPRYGRRVGRLSGPDRPADRAMLTIAWYDDGGTIDWVRN